MNDLRMLDSFNWGYDPFHYSAPEGSYAVQSDGVSRVKEYRQMVQKLHQLGFRVVQDVVYNHTSEGDETGPVYSFRGYDRSVYYILSEDKKYYMNYSGCGNTLNGTHSVVRRMIIDSLHFWVEKMHIDGFRFDLASILSRDESGKPMISPPTLWSIDTDPTLSSVKLIAEAWDAGGLYQVGSLAGKRWREWNGQFRDDVRRFIKGDEGMISKFVSRLIGSPDMGVVGNGSSQYDLNWFVDRGESVLQSAWFISLPLWAIFFIYNVILP